MLQRQGFPFVVVDPREPPPEGIACVSAMHASGAKQATEHLLELGHRRIGAIAGQPGWYATEERLIGFRAALAGAGILLDPELIVYSDWRIPQRHEAAEQLLSLPDPPTAIFGFNDNVAIGALHAARKRGLSVPGDLSVVGFDDTEPAVIVHAAAHLGAPAARRDGTDGCEPARAADRRPARRRAARRARRRSSSSASRPRHRRVQPRRTSRASRSLVLAALCSPARRRGDARARERPAQRVRRAPARLRRARGARRIVDARLVNAWGLAASPTGPWWTANEASATSTLYSGDGTKAAAHRARSTAARPGSRSTAASGFPCACAASSDPARFVYACEDGMLRAWTPTVPRAWSTEAVVVVDEAAEAAVFRGVAIVGDRVYATDFHNARVDVYDAHWRRVRRSGAFVDRCDPGRGTRRSASA